MLISNKTTQTIVVTIHRKGGGKSKEFLIPSHKGTEIHLKSINDKVCVHLVGNREAGKVTIMPGNCDIELQSRGSLEGYHGQHTQVLIRIKPE